MRKAFGPATRVRGWDIMEARAGRGLTGQRGIQGKPGDQTAWSGRQGGLGALKVALGRPGLEVSLETC